MATRLPFWKWRCWKSIGFYPWPQSICIWNLKFKFKSKLGLCSGNNGIYRWMDRWTEGQTRWIQYTPSIFWRGIVWIAINTALWHMSCYCTSQWYELLFFHAMQPKLITTANHQMVTYVCHFNVTCCISVCNNYMLIYIFFVKSFHLPFQIVIFHFLTFYMFVLDKGDVVCLHNMARQTYLGRSEVIDNLQLPWWPLTSLRMSVWLYHLSKQYFYYILFIESVDNLYCSDFSVPMCMWWDFCTSLISSFSVKTTDNNKYVSTGCNDFIWHWHTGSIMTVVLTCVSIIYALYWIWNISCIVLCHREMMMNTLKKIIRRLCLSFNMLKLEMHLCIHELVNS